MRYRLAQTFLLIFLTSFLFKNTYGYEKALIFIDLNKTFIVETAITEIQKKRGLMFREKFKNTNGMILIYKIPQIVTIWMKNTLMDLDIIFINNEKKIISIKHGKKLNIDLISSQKPVIAVLEIPRNCSEKLGIKVNNKINWKLVKNNQNFLSDKLDLLNCL